MAPKTDEITLAFKFKIATLLTFLSLVFGLGVTYANFLSLEREFEAMKKREEVMCTKVNDISSNIARISLNIEWIRESMKSLKENRK